MTKAKFKKAMKDCMKKYNVGLEVAVKMAHTNYPDHFENITKAELELAMDQMLGKL